MIYSYFNCESCNLCKLSGIEYAFPRVNRGNGEKIMFIGEAPGSEEGYRHTSFIGRSGKLLDRWIESLDISNYYITNIVKHRPPYNRKPEQDEINACFPYLEQEITDESPSSIILLGRTPQKVIFPTLNSSMADIINRSIDGTMNYKGIRTFVLFHPSYILRTGIDISEILNHLKEELIDL